LTSDKNIFAFIAGSNYADAAELLLKQQRKEWNVLDENYKSLLTVKTKTIWFNAFRIKLQYNPIRIKSTSAIIDKEFIESRNCFLCGMNLPVKQEGINILDDYILLCNPYPVFPEHFTIVLAEHKPQEILLAFYNFINIGKRLANKYSIIYNGPKCGASAPDHLHFQAFTKQVMPIEDDYYSVVNEYGELILCNNNITVYAVDDGLRKFITIESKDKTVLGDTFSIFYENYLKLKDSDEEPLMNIICKYSEESGWKIIVFIRSKHRSSHYFLDGDSKIVISPAAIDLGGMCITPVEKDFEKLDRNLIAAIFKEIFTGKEEFDYLKSSLEKLNS
jgi:hypothetical protein